MKDVFAVTALKKSTGNNRQSPVKRAVPKNDSADQGEKGSSGRAGDVEDPAWAVTMMITRMRLVRRIGDVFRVVRLTMSDIIEGSFTATLEASRKEGSVSNVRNGGGVAAATSRTEVLATDIDVS